MKLVKHIILPFERASDINEWRLEMELEYDKIYNTDVSVRHICQESVTDGLIDQVNKMLTVNR